MFFSLLNTLAFFSFFCELFALILALYFKQPKIFFLALALLLSRLVYFWTSPLQAQLFLSLFLPLLFFLLSLKKSNNLIFEKANLSHLFLLFIFILAGIFLAKNNSLNFSLLNTKIAGSYSPALLFLSLEFLFLCLKFYKKDPLIPIAFVGLAPHFVLENFFDFFFIVPLFEFASLIFLAHFLLRFYCLIFIDPLTKMKNLNALKLHTRGKKAYFLARLHFDEFEKTRDAYVKIIRKKISTKLKKLQAKIFVLENDFILFFDEEKNMLDLLGYLESLLKNKELILENESFAPTFTIKWTQCEADLNTALENLKRQN